ncbi:MAG: glutamyl-tRNA reductase, partial [Bacteroidota bacterium]
MLRTPFKAISLSFKSAPVEIRELIYLPEEVCKSLLRQVREVLGIEEALIFSTCNRTEVYYVSEEDHTDELIKLLCIAKGIEKPLSHKKYFRCFSEDQDAINYLFEVSMGLESNVLGDLQISSQVKNAYAWSHELGMAGAFLHRLMHTIFHTNKRVQQETPFRDGAASVSYASAELASELVNGILNPTALVIGLGEMGRDVAKNLDLDAFARVDLCNRTRSKAEELALEIGVGVVSFEQVFERLHTYDVVISAVTAEQPMFTCPMFEENHPGMQFVLDLSMPRSIAADVEELSHVVLYNVDDIHSRTNQVMQRREAAIPQVKSIIQEEVIA